MTDNSLLILFAAFVLVAVSLFMYYIFLKLCEVNCDLKIYLRCPCNTSETNFSTGDARLPRYDELHFADDELHENPPSYEEAVRSVVPASCHHHLYI